MCLADKLKVSGEKRPDTFLFGFRIKIWVNWLAGKLKSYNKSCELLPPPILSQRAGNGSMGGNHGRIIKTFELFIIYFLPHQSGWVRMTNRSPALHCRIKSIGSVILPFFHFPPESVRYLLYSIW